MKILFVGSEAAPFVKTGGLGDVLGALPGELHALGHDARVVLPFYSVLDVRRFPCRLVLDNVYVHLPAGTRNVSIWQIEPRHTSVPVYLIKDDAFFARFGIYDERGHDYQDNPLRFSYFCMAVFWMIKGLDWIPDLFHCHDWQSSMIPTYLNNMHFLRDDPDFAGCRTLLTIHNLAYQGVCPPRYLPQLGLRWDMFNVMEVEFFGKLNLLKAGLVYADHLSTVSRRYAQEIQTPEFGCGLEGVLRHRSGQLHGIMNGIDIDVWNPQTDPHLPARYGAENLEGKAQCKAALQKEFNLPVDAKVPLLAIVSRVVEQKGFDLVTEAIHEILRMGVQYVMLGRGMELYERQFEALARAHPRQMGVRIDYGEPLAHRIEAGADMFLMPSRFEPCGLNQLYSMRYGTVPIVHRTGGLADSVVDALAHSIEAGDATGFSFEPYQSDRFLACTRQAVDLYRSNRDAWTKLMVNGMTRDFSWRHSAMEYETLMERIASTGKLQFADA